MTLDDLARRLVDAWNRGDARAWASLFTLTAKYVTGTGGSLHGRDAISSLLETPGAQVSIVGQPEVRCDARFGEVTFMWSSADAKGTQRHGRITCACMRDGSNWLVESLENNETRSGPSS